MRPPVLPAISRRIGALPRPLRMAAYAIACAVLLTLCLAPVDTLPGAGLFWDKWEHVAGWGVLTLLGLALSPRRPLAIIAFALAFGATVELLQAVIGFGRHGDLLDLFADSLGVLAAVIAAWIAARLRGR